MRIIMIGQKGLPAQSGGIERHVEDLATRLVREGHEVIVYCRSSYTRNHQVLKTYKGIRCITVPTLPGKNLETVIQTFFASIHALFMRADIIHYHGIGPSLFAWIPRIFAPNVRVIATFHCQDYFHQKWGALARMAFRLGEVVACTVTHRTIAVSETIREYIKKTYDRDAAYLPNAVALRTRESDDTHVRRLRLERQDYLLLVSRLVRHKNIHFVIKAYNELLSRGALLPKLAIVGSSCHTDDYESELRNLAAGNPNILFAGEQTGETLAQLYSHARFFVHASCSEGLSYAILEAMSYGCPVLVSDIAENKEILHAVGTTFKTNDSEDFMKQLNFLLESQDTNKTCALDYSRVIDEYYNVETVFSNMLSLYVGLSPRQRHS